nr:single-stranded DNA-binding protein [Bacteroides stercorirosoris]
MIYTHTIGRIGAKDCRVITGTHGTFMAVDIAVDDYSKGKQITTWVRVKSSKENHIRLAEYLTKGRMVLVEGTLTSSIWTDRNGENHIQHSIIADSIAFVNAGKKDAADTPATKHVRQPRQRARLPYRQPMHRRTRAKTFPSEVVSTESSTY